jgi:hypothetical protein
MAKGAIAKEEVTAKILEVFDGAFKYDKEIRIPVMEGGELVQIKVTLTCAKANVEPEGDFPAPVDAPVTPVTNTSIEPTEDEKATVAALLKKLGM